MSLFSQRYGYTSLEKAFQRESIDDPLRTKLWNILKVAIWDRYDIHNSTYDQVSQRIERCSKRVWFDHFNYDLDEFPAFYNRRGNKGFYQIYKEYFLSCEWYELYDFLEVLAKDPSKLLDGEVREWINSELEAHNAAYRLVENQIVEITDSNEINAIESALEDSDSYVKEHLNKSLQMLSDKESPDYRNAVKEAISAVEAACRSIADKPSATLGDALKRIEDIHPALKQAFNKLYGYTNDASGIRHALSDELDISYADAKFMLVACSAFISYLTASTNRSGK